MLVALVGCGPGEVILEGERLDVRPGSSDVSENQDVAISLAAPVHNTEWSHRGASANHVSRQAAFSATPAKIWSASIGKGNDRKHRISSDPVAADGRIFTLDSRAQVVATGTDGQAIWSRDLTPADDKADDASGGGLAVVAGRLYVTTGFGDLFALDAASGAIQWQQRLNSPATGAPTVTGGTIYIATRDSHALAINASDGLLRWQFQGAPSVTGIIGGAAPAVDSGLAVFPFGSTQLTGAYPKGGFQIWGGSVAGHRLGRGYGQINDVSGDPVLSGKVVYVGNPSGRTVALDRADGTTLWIAPEGAVSPLWVAGDSVFLISDQAELVRLNASDGTRIWGVQLPGFHPKRRTKRLRDVYAHFGPVLAGGRLWVASDDGQLRGFDPANGGQVATVDLGTGAASRPIVVGGVMYLVDTKGKLQALR
ncbi:MAG: PQQ-like beta-propeller repeat protein [Marinosulfonomonas sp.]|nr:PQQ-like beta-propeller repeat protein [Marinosulfonomonas sp.]